MASKVEDFGNITKHRLIWGVGGVFLWMLIFSAGVLIPSEPSRKNLGWTGATTPAVATTTVAEKPIKHDDPPIICDFLLASLTFTPLNVGYLCVLAAFIGGCSINKNEIRRIQQQIIIIESSPLIPPNPEVYGLRQRLDYLTEHPGYSIIRGLVVYLIIISGLFIIGAPLTGEDDNQGVSLAQYIKMAGLFSFFGYLSGYDPTVFSSVIGFGAKHLNSTKTKD